MRPRLRLTALAATALLLLNLPAQGQTGATGSDSEEASVACKTYCTATAAACGWMASQAGISPEFCLGWLDGCLYGCTL